MGNKEHSANGDYAKDCNKVLFLLRCIAFFNRIPIKSSRIRNLAAMHPDRNVLAAVFNVVVCWASLLVAILVGYHLVGGHALREQSH